MTVKFSNALVIPANYTNIDGEVLSVRVIAGRNSVKANVALTNWTVTCMEKLY